MLFMQEDTQLTAIFPDLERYLTGANAPMRVAGSHGLLCARYCTQGKPDFQEWVEAIIGPVNEADLTMQSCSQQLLLVFEKTSRLTWFNIASSGYVRNITLRPLVGTRSETGFNNE